MTFTFPYLCSGHLSSLKTDLPVATLASNPVCTLLLEFSDMRVLVNPCSTLLAFSRRLELPVSGRQPLPVPPCTSVAPLRPHLLHLCSPCGLVCLDIPWPPPSHRTDPTVCKFISAILSSTFPESSPPPEQFPLEKGMANQSSTLAWRVPWTEEPGRLHLWGHKESDMTEVNLALMHQNSYSLCAPATLHTNVHHSLVLLTRQNFSVILKSLRQ